MWTEKYVIVAPGSEQTSSCTVKVLAKEGGIEREKEEDKEEER